MNEMNVERCVNNSGQLTATDELYQFQAVPFGHRRCRELFRHDNALIELNDEMFGIQAQVLKQGGDGRLLNYGFWLSVDGDIHTSDFLLRCFIQQYAHHGVGLMMGRNPHARSHQPAARLRCGCSISAKDEIFTDPGRFDAV